jgi:UDPglucose--hexose-1-phosphate uridylyltransferase
MSTPIPEYRRDPVSNRWVIIAPERSLRPLGLSGSKPHIRRDAERDRCPFCEGQEKHTTGEVYAIRDPDSSTDGPGWTLRVVPNKFPAVRMLVDITLQSSGDLFESYPGFGLHEVVIECPYHETNPTHLTDDEFRAVLMAYRSRIADMSHQSHFSYVMVFKNVGAEAGASLAHSHSQIIAMPVVPDTIRQELEGSSDYYQRFRRCVFCDIIRDAQTEGSRLIEQTENFIAVAPFAPRFACETWVLPKKHSSRYEEISDTPALELASLMRLVLRKLDTVLGYPAYNYFLHNGPLRANNLPYYHWHLEIVPRTARAAGFEWGSGTFINAVLPEVAAAELRRTIPSEQDTIFI